MALDGRGVGQEDAVSRVCALALRIEEDKIAERWATVTPPAEGSPWAKAQQQTAIMKWASFLGKIVMGAPARFNPEVIDTALSVQCQPKAPTDDSASATDTDQWECLATSVFLAQV